MSCWPAECLSFHTVAFTRFSSKDTESPVNLTVLSLDSRFCSCLVGTDRGE